MIRTMPHPGFPTDVQAQMMALTTIADGTSVFVENIFESRYKHVGELLRFGAKISVEGRMAVVEGVKSLNGAKVKATDLRGGSAMILAGLCANGKTEITEIHHIDRGYDEPEKCSVIWVRI
jgi:UDP-N-acetylglucosamine 1-carboxyvinyltransferase